MSGIEFDKGGRAKFVRVGEKVLVGQFDEVDHMGLLSRLNPGLAHITADFDTVEGGVDMGSLAVKKSQEGVLVSGESVGLCWPPESPETRRPLRTKTLKVLKKRYPDTEFTLEDS